MTQPEWIEEKYRWLRKNRGVIAEIARTHGVSHGMVRKAFFELTQSIDPRLMRALVRAKAPGFETDRSAQ